ncbi:hypothetical protein [Luteibacter sp. UNCMF366Tsu5.1]|uniref:hypothetical protein n=1 Tax=Luteibacter sp. UNCMF366Tsu5.1 TaxID=1502758 RepID=UPI0009091C9E|nr:hypothetical protein [Luteibacter sp. UNCMF366Tsu5.1]SFW24486.1 hypothetical protein SAMN02800691_0500 [Luteibacter sp. UNCMF366Tsu5.1]
MEREFKVGSARFVVDDPRGLLGVAEATPLKAEQLGIETARTRDEEAWPFSPIGHPNPNDPIGNIGARVAVLDGIVQGRTSPWTLGFAWFFSAIDAFAFAALIWMSSTSIVARGLAIGAVICHTVFFLRAKATMLGRRAGKKAYFSR